MNNSITYRKLTTLEELEEARRLEKHVWQMDTTPVLQTLTNTLNGGFTIGAYHHGQMIGFSYGFPGFKDGRIYFCSHMLGIHRDWRHKGLGTALKQQQRLLALEMGYSLITWTFDPLESVNANLNLNKLHGICTDYDPNHYGDMNDGLNDGLPTDRFLLEWRIRSGYVAKWPEWLASLAFDESAVCMKVQGRGAGFPQPGPLCEPQNPHVRLVPIPLGFQQIKKDDFSLAYAWRMQAREALVAQLEQGRIVARLLKDREAGLGWYCLLDRKRIMDAIDGGINDSGVP